MAFLLDIGAEHGSVFPQDIPSFLAMQRSSSLALICDIPDALKFIDSCCSLTANKRKYSQVYANRSRQFIPAKQMVKVQRLSIDFHRMQFLVTPVYQRF